MKIIRVFVLAILILSLHSCIPSLHGIVTDATRTTDDRILCRWSYHSDVLQTELEEGDLFTLQSSKELDYTFERAMNITFIENDQTIRMEGVSRSRLDPIPTQNVKEELLPYYILTHRELINQDTVISYFRVEMTQINQHLMLDILPIPQDEGVFAGHFATNYVMAHTFAKIRFEAGSLIMNTIDAEYIEQLISQKRIRLKHERRNEGEIILTATTRELREFIDNYSDDTNLFESGDWLYPVQ